MRCSERQPRLPHDDYWTFDSPFCARRGVSAAVAELGSLAVGCMDTDDLTPMARQTLTLGFEVCAPLRAEIGVAASVFKTEDEFLHGISGFMEEILADPKEDLDLSNLLDEVDQAEFIERLLRVQDHIAITLKTPRIQRGKPPFEE